MAPLHVVMDGAQPALWQSLVTALSPAVVAGLAALGGVWLTNLAVQRHRKEDRRQRAIELQLEAEAREARERRDRGLAGLALAEHLEDFVLHCHDVIFSFRNTAWDSPFHHDENTGAPVWLKPIPEWPPLVDWRLLGMDTAVKATNFRRRVHLVRESLNASAEHGYPEDAHADDADAAAALGSDGWDLAIAVRRVCQLDPFEWPQGWSGVDLFREHVERREKFHAEHGAGTIEMD